MAFPILSRRHQRRVMIILTALFVVVLQHQANLKKLRLETNVHVSESKSSTNYAYHHEQHLENTTTVSPTGSPHHVFPTKPSNPLETSYTTLYRPHDSGLILFRNSTNHSGNGNSILLKENETKSTSSSLKKTTFQVSSTDFVYQKSKSRDAAPVVLEEYKLIFFTIPKVACTVWKKLFRRMMGYPDWNKQSLEHRASMLPYNPDVNGLKYLYHYSVEDATRLITSPEYTRALFVRDPKERFLSAYLDKALGDGGSYLVGACCPDRKCVVGAQTVAGFLDLARTCYDDHWMPQSRRMEPKYWSHINFVGHYANRNRDARRLLEQVGAWNTHGRSGWGRYGNESIFSSSHGVAHTTGAARQVQKYMTSVELKRQIDEYYKDDYLSPWLNLTKTTFLTQAA